MIHIERYSSKDSEAWNTFVERSKNGTFLIDRRYMEYHSDRFLDASLLFYNDKGNLVALLPANLSGKLLSSHDGLTYGGLVMDNNITTATATDCFQMLKTWMGDNGIETMRYKPTPYIYHRYPASEDLYALMQCFHDVTIASRDVSTSILLPSPLPWRELRRRCLRKAGKAGITVVETEDYGAFWTILDNNLLSRYGVHPVHSLEEIMRLHSLFPEKIRLFMAYRGEMPLAGMVMYDANTMVTHSQYISATPEGRDCGALDAIVHHLLSEVYTSPRYFDFGKSTEGASSLLNANLIFQKEGFGGRAVCYDTYILR